MPPKQDLSRKKNGPDILFGSGSVDPTILASVIQSFYRSEDSDEKSNDRRKYNGKHQKNGMKTKNADSRKTDSSKNGNSPMYIRLKS
jgi:hypothetical protein